MDLVGKRVLVTGADGFIGSHLVERVVAAGAETTAMVQYNSFGTAGWMDEVADDVRTEVRIAAGDIRDSGSVESLVVGHDLVFHLAALIAIPYSYDAPQSYVDVNVHGTLNVLTAARKAGTGRVVHTSTSEVYGSALTKPISESHPLQGQSPYSASKIGADMMAQAFALSFDLPVAVLRPFNAFGPRQSERAVIPTIVRQALDPNCDEIRLGDLRPTRDFNYVSDTVSAFVALGTGDNIKFGTPYNAGTGVEVSVGDVATRVRALSGVNKPVVQDNNRMRPSNSEVQALISDSRSLTEATGWKSNLDLDAGLSQTIEWWRERLSLGKTRPDANYLK